MTIRINFRALLRPVCWLQGHIWQNYAVINAWCREGRFCEWCGKQQFVTYRFEFARGETINVRTDWNGTTRFVYASAGSGNVDDPIRLMRLPVSEVTDAEGVSIRGDATCDGCEESVQECECG